MGRIRGTFALVAAACCVANLALMLLAVDFDIERLHAFAALHDVDDTGASLLVASMVFDAGFYLSLVPVALALTSTITHRRVTRAAGVLYGVVGAAGALTLAIGWSRWFARIDAGDLEATARFVEVTEAVYRTVWHQICASLGALWWLTLAWRERRGHMRLALASAALGVASAVQVLVVTTKLEGADVVLDVYLALLLVWTVTAGASLLTRDRA